MSISKKIHLVGYASGLAGPVRSSENGPIVLQQSSYMAALEPMLTLQWHKMIGEPTLSPHTKKTLIAEFCQELASETYKLTTNKEFFVVLGGDHSSAIGTWSGMQYALKKQGPIGLIWIDAHMDSHTPDTSQTGNIHGMPLAALLGHGDPVFTTILDADPKLKPEHICLIGVRSYERGEIDLLKKLNIRIFFMEEVIERGLEVVMKEALEIATQGTVGFGITIDIDSMDPKDAPGTGVAEPGGILAQDLFEALKIIGNDTRLIGAEIAEFDPKRDQNQKTEKLIPQLIAILALGHQHKINMN